MTSNNQTDFINFDLARMKKAVEAKSHTMPDTIKSFDDFNAWLDTLPKTEDSNDDN